MINLHKAAGKLPAQELDMPIESPEAGSHGIHSARERRRPEKPRLLLLARALNQGGAQRQLIMLACGLRARGGDVSVARFYAGYPWEDELRHAGVTLHDLRKRGRWDVMRFLFRFGRLLRAERPTILHGYLSVPNLLTVILRPLLPGTRIVWGIRASDGEFNRSDWLARFMFFLECRMAFLADLIITNSQAGMDYCVAHGYPKHKMLVIPNGIDTERFQFDAQGRRRLRGQWGVAAESVLIGLVGRLDPRKDHSTFLQAAALLARRDSRCRFVCVGDGPPDYADELRRKTRALGLDDRLIWARARDDMAAAYSALDILCSSSYSEGLPNVVAEAMACGRPCVVTRVGDSAAVVGDTGMVVPPNDPILLGDALAHFLHFGPDKRSQLGVEARKRIVEQFSVERMLDATSRALKCL